MWKIEKCGTPKKNIGVGIDSRSFNHLPRPITKIVSGARLIKMVFPLVLSKRIWVDKPANMEFVVLGLFFVHVKRLYPSYDVGPIEIVELNLPVAECVNGGWRWLDKVVCACLQNLNILVS